jgi:hypothetical protein
MHYYMIFIITYRCASSNNASEILLLPPGSWLLLADCYLLGQHELASQTTQYFFYQYLTSSILHLTDIFPITAQENMIPADSKVSTPAKDSVGDACFPSPPASCQPALILQPHRSFLAEEVL